MADFQLTKVGIDSINAYSTSPAGGPRANLSWCQVFHVDNTFDMNDFSDIAVKEDQYAYIQARALWGYDLQNPTLIIDRPTDDNPPLNPPLPLIDAARRGLNVDSAGGNYDTAFNLQGTPIRQGIHDVRYDYTIPVTQGTYTFNLMCIFNAEGIDPADRGTEEQMPIFAAYISPQPITKIGGQGTIVINGVIRYMDGVLTDALEYIIETTERASLIKFSSVESLPTPTSPALADNNIFLIESGSDTTPTGPVPYGRDSEGNAYTALLKDDLWCFSNFAVDITHGQCTIESSTVNSIEYDDALSPLGDIDTNEMGNYIIQFTNGGSKGVCRTVSEINTSANTISWLVDVGGGIAGDTTTFALYESTALYIQRSAILEPGSNGQILTMISPSEYAFRFGPFGYQALASEKLWPTLDIDTCIPSVNFVKGDIYSVTVSQVSDYFNVPGIIHHYNVTSQHIRQMFIATGNSLIHGSNSFMATREWSETAGFSRWQIYRTEDQLPPVHPIVQEIRKAEISFPKVKSNVDDLALSMSTTFLLPVLSQTGKIYYIPSRNPAANNQVGIYDILSDSFETPTFSGVTLTGSSWGGSALGVDGQIYSVPFNASNIFIIDPIDNTASLSNMGATISGSNLWFGLIPAPNGNLYGIPFDSTEVLIIDVEAGTATTTDFGLDLSGSNKWSSGQLGADGLIYCTPYNSNSVLIIDPIDNSARLENFGLNLAGSAKWVSMHLGGNANLYCIPEDANDVLVINTSSQSAERTDFGLNLTGTDKFASGCIGSDGKIYGLPNSRSDCLVISPSLNEAWFDDFGNAAVFSGSIFYGGILSPDGAIYSSIDDNAAFRIYSRIAPPLSNTSVLSSFLNKR